MSREVQRLGLLTLFALGLTAGLARCGGSRAVVPGVQCARGANPISMMAPGQQKADPKTFVIPDGEYTLTRASMHFRGDPTPKAPDGFQVLMREDVPKNSKDGASQLRTECFRNAKVDRIHNVTVPAVTHVVVKNGRVEETSVKQFGFNVDETSGFEFARGPSLRKADRAPHQLLDPDAEETFILPHGSDFEIRTNGRGLNGHYTMALFLRRVN